MSDKVSGFIVTFDESVSEEYMEKIKNSMLLFKGVINVSPVIEQTQTFLGAMQEKHYIVDQLVDLLKNDFNRKKE